MLGTEMMEISVMMMDVIPTVLWRLDMSEHPVTPQHQVYVLIYEVMVKSYNLILHQHSEMMVTQVMEMDVAPLVL